MTLPTVQVFTAEHVHNELELIHRLLQVTTTAVLELAERDRGYDPETARQRARDALDRHTQEHPLNRLFKALGDLDRAAEEQLEPVEEPTPLAPPEPEPWVEPQTPADRYATGEVPAMADAGPPTVQFDAIPPQEHEWFGSVAPNGAASH